MNSGLLEPPIVETQSPPARSVRSVTAAQELAAYVPPIEQSLQMTPGLIDGAVEAVHFSALRLYDVQVNRGVEVRFFNDPNALVVGFLLKGSRVIVGGQTWDAGQAYVAPESQVELTSLAGSRILWLRMERDRVSPSSRDALAPLRRPFLADGQRFSQVHSLTERAFYGRGVFVERELERTLADTLQRAAPEGKESLRERRSLALVRSVEAYMWENVEEPLTLERICSELQCGVRALIYAFKDVYGVGPMTYWKACRLNGAHRKLRESMGKVPILEIAADFGFWHMGHFSADHKQLFGMTPSQAIEIGRLRAREM